MITSINFVELLVVCRPIVHKISECDLILQIFRVLIIRRRIVLHHQILTKIVDQLFWCIRNYRGISSGSWYTRGRTSSKSSSSGSGWRRYEPREDFWYGEGGADSN